MKKISLIFLLGLLLINFRANSQLPYIGELRLVPFNFVPKEHAACNGQLLPISEYEALYNLIGTMYGGDGVSTFALPDLRGRVPVHISASKHIGMLAGVETVILTQSQLPVHSHTMTVKVKQAASSDVGTSKDPQGYPAVMNNTRITPYSTVANSGAGTMTATTPINGGNQPHNNVKPYLALHWVIALYGIYPSPAK
jgi:microcystin-dependent protein